MQALWLENHRLSTKEIPQPEKSGEALVRIRKAGICGTDLELVKGYYPYTGIPGHEFVGEVLESPDPAWMGKRVVGEINVVCGVCEQCRSGRTTHCENRSVLGIVNRDGVFAEFTTLPLENLHRVPDEVTDEAAVFTEPLAAALEIQQQVQIHPTDRVLLIGAGRLGQLIAQTLALTGCALRVVARHSLQKNLLTGRGIQLIDAEEVQHQRYDLVVEATGSPSGFELARKALRPRGTLVLKSTYKGDMTVNFSSIVVDEIQLIGSRCGPFEPALRLLANKQVDPTLLIAAEYSLRDGLKAFAEAEKTGMLKVLLNS
jgi:2-desacetyl-2-hydroxyethyl bacteriochlorophyllide A dehydrogenase